MPAVAAVGWRIAGLRSQRLLAVQHGDQWQRGWWDIGCLEDQEPLTPQLRPSSYGVEESWGCSIAQ